jgi:hypothetical protein
MLLVSLPGNTVPLPVGEYYTNLPANPRATIRITENDVTLLNGCNLLSSDYMAYDNGTINFGRFFETSNDCPDNSDQVFADAFSNSFIYIIEGQEIAFLNQEGENIRLFKVPDLPIEQVTFYGEYSTNLPQNPNIRVSFT